MSVKLLGLMAIAGRLKSVSFSQYGEDVLTAVSLLPGGSGTYVDAGAFHPTHGSNTYKLYLRGWRGLTIEPDPAAEAEFRRYRPHDVHVVEGIAGEPGALPYFRFADGKINTFDPDKAAASVAKGARPMPSLTIPCRPLQSIVDEHLPGSSIDLLSIDCEAFDFVVLKSLDFSRCRPTAILIEDFEGFHRMREGRAPGAIETFLRDREYGRIGQAVFTSLYVDLSAAGRREQGAFDFSRTQILPRSSRPVSATAGSDS